MQVLQLKPQSFKESYKRERELRQDTNTKVNG